MKYDVIGDIHGCYDEMIALIEKLGYSLSSGFPVPVLQLHRIAFEKTVQLIAVIAGHISHSSFFNGPSYKFNDLQRFWPCIYIRRQEAENA